MYLDVSDDEVVDLDQETTADMNGKNNIYYNLNYVFFNLNYIL